MLFALPTAPRMSTLVNSQICLNRFRLQKHPVRESEKIDLSSTAHC